MRDAHLFIFPPFFSDYQWRFPSSQQGAESGVAGGGVGGVDPLQCSGRHTDTAAI